MVCFQVKAELNYSDLLTVTDMVCSVAFDRDDEFFATAGVFRRVKIFDFASVQDSDTSIHYPVLEIPSRSVASTPPISANTCAKLLHHHHSDMSMQSVGLCVAASGRAYATTVTFVC